MKTCPKCKTTKIPNEANFCPSCGKQLTEGTWAVVNLSPKANVTSSVKDVVKKFTLQNDTNTILQCFQDGVSTKFQLPPHGCNTIEVAKATSLRIVADYIYIDIKLYNNDIFNKIIIYKNWDSLHYRTL